MTDNMVTLVGAIGTEPELRTTPQGTDVVNFSMATNERTRNGDGRWVDGPTSWFRVAVWGTLGRNSHASLHKGQRVVVHGVLRITEYSTENAGTAKRAEVRAVAVGHDLTFGTSAYTRVAPSSSTARPAQQAVQQAQQQPAQAWSAQPVPEPAEPQPAGMQAAWSAPMADVAVPF